MQEINHYVVQIGNQLPILVKNTTATLFTELPTNNHTIRLRAVDMCGQEGEELVVTLEGRPPVAGEDNTDTTTLSPTTTTEKFKVKATSFLGHTLSGAIPTHSKLYSLSCYFLISSFIFSFVV